MTIQSLLHSHFTTYQHEASSSTTNNNNNAFSSSAWRAASLIQSELTSFRLEGEIQGLSLATDEKKKDDNHSNDENMSDATNDNTQALTQALQSILDNAMVSLHSNKESHDAVYHTCELLCALISLSSSASATRGGSKESCGWEAVCQQLVHRCIQYSTVDKDTVRKMAVHCLLWMVGGWMNVKNGGTKGGLKSALKSGGRSGSKNTAGNGAKTGSGNGDNNSSVKLEPWKRNLITLAASALLMRCTDKISKVRGVAISGVGVFFRFWKETDEDDDENDDETKEENEEENELNQLATQFQSLLLWLASNDPSASNRSLALSTLSHSTCRNRHVSLFVERLRDVDVKVREAALECLSEVRLEELGEEMLGVLRGGLTKR